MKQDTKKLAIVLLVGSLFITMSFSGCLGTKADFEDDELGAGLIADELGRPSIDPSIYGQNLIWDNDTETLSAIDRVGGGDGYRSESSIEYVVEAMVHDSMNFAHYAIMDLFDKIWTSDGRIYNATNTSLQLAIDNLEGGIGEVHVPSGYFEIDVLNITYGVTVIGAGSMGYEDAQRNGLGGTQFNLSSNTDTIRLSGGRLWNVKLLCPDGYTGVAINVSIEVGGSGVVDAYYMTKNILNDVRVLNGEHIVFTPSGTGVQLYADYGGSWLYDHPITYGCSFNSIVVQGFEYGLLLDATQASSYISANVFNDIEVYGNKYNIYLDGSSAGNLFSNIHIEGRPNSTHGIYCGANAGRNQFTNVRVYDWNQANGPVLNILGDYNRFTGWFGLNEQGINITGIGNEIETTGDDDNLFIINPTGYKDGTRIDDTITDVSIGDGCKVIFMPGTYDIDKMISKDTVDITYEFMSGVVFEVNASFSDSYVLYLGEGDCVYGSGEIDGNDVAGVTGIRARTDSSVSGLYIHNFADDGIYSSSKNMTVFDCKIENISTDGIFLEGHDNNNIMDCSFYNCTNYAIRLYSSDNNKIIYNYMNCTVYLITDSNNNIIQGNTFLNAKRGIYVATDTCDNNSVVSNTIKDCTLQGVWDRGTDTIIKDNHISGCTPAITTTTTSNAVRPLINNNKGFDFNSIFPFYNVTDPSTVTVPDDMMVYIYDNDDGWFYTKARVNNTYFYVNWTTTI